MHRIDYIFNELENTSLSMKKVYSDGENMVRYSDKFYGYRMIYDLTNTRWQGVELL